MPQLTAESLTVRMHGGRRTDRRSLVDDVSFSVRDGEIVGIVGESGAGKSMVIRAILGLTPANFSVSGAVTVDGEVLPFSPGTARRKSRTGALAAVFQDPLAALSPHQTVGRQIEEVGRAVYRSSVIQARADALELLSRVSLNDPRQIARKYPGELSGGQRQRVLIAAALAARPRFLLCDEPTTALDVTLQAEIVELLATLVTEEALGLVIVSHDIAMLSGLADRIIVMADGKIVEEGTVRAIINSPVHPVTVNLIGTAAATEKNFRQLVRR
ncbi:MAG: ABC transporter ATP-binding protein [Gordonia sp. (in: high G+C Gram-positive bacteria)]